jgi:hypothetical protein
MEAASIFCSTVDWRLFSSFLRNKGFLIQIKETINSVSKSISGTIEGGSGFNADWKESGICFQVRMEQNELEDRFREDLLRRFKEHNITPQEPAKQWATASTLTFDIPFADIWAPPLKSKPDKYGGCRKRF